MNLNPGLSPEEYTTKAMRSMGFLMESLLDDPCVRRAVPCACFCNILLRYAAVEAMGFPHEICHLALKRAKGNTERAAEWILSNMCDARPMYPIPHVAGD